MGEGKKSKKLTTKQSAFVNAYLQSFNATRAAREARYSKKTAYAIGWENLRKPEIAAEIERRLSELGMGKNEVLARLAQHARGDFSPFLTQNGDSIGIDLSSEQAQQALNLVKKVKSKVRRGGKEGETWEEVETEIELHDPQAALVHIGRHHNCLRIAPSTRARTASRCRWRR